MQLGVFVRAVNAQHRRRARTRGLLRLIQRAVTGGLVWFLHKKNGKAPSLVFTVGMLIADDQLKWTQTFMTLATFALGLLASGHAAADGA